jgi:hypothetical protein
LLSLEEIEKRSTSVFRLATGLDSLLGEEEDERFFEDIRKMKPRLEAANGATEGFPRDKTGWLYCKPRYLMHDLLDVPIIRRNDNGNCIVSPDIVDIKLEEKSSGCIELRGCAMEIERDAKTSSFCFARENIVDWKAIKIESNIG